MGLMSAKRFAATAAAVLLAALFCFVVAQSASASTATGGDSPETPSSVETSGLELKVSEASEDAVAYDPIAEIEAVQEERDSASYVDSKVVFAVRDYRSDVFPNFGFENYLDDNNELAVCAGLSDVSFIMEFESSTAEPRMGYTAYDVYYEATTPSSDVWATVDLLMEQENVLFAEPDYIWETDGTQASADEIAKCWHHDYMNLPHLWGDKDDDSALAGNAGEGVVVAVIDTGVDYAHVDLDSNIWVNVDEVAGNNKDDDGNGYVDDVHGYDFVEDEGDPMDDHGHGTHVAGIIAMEAGNEGGVGVAHNAQVMAIKAGQATGSFSSTDIAKAIQYASANGADVINMSFGGTGKSSLVEAALADAFGTCVLVAAAGNDGIPTADAPDEFLKKADFYPAGYTYVIGVMASDSNGNLASFSNWDYYGGQNAEYELVAPGAKIYSTLPGDRYASWDGTSMAAPMVSAAAALIRAENPDKSVYTSRYIMGQLASATSDTVTYVDKVGEKHSYALLNIEQALTEQPKPSLVIEKVYVFDGVDISDVNNGDGIVQAGETVDIGIVVRNQWGIASDVKVSASAMSAGGVPNPYIEFLASEVELGGVGTFATINNGFVYDNDMLVGVSNPIRMRVSEDAPNNGQIKIDFEITAKNGMDAEDKAVYGLVLPCFKTLVVQKGQELRGVISEDMTLTSDKLWIINSAVIIDEGVTVTVEPGAQIQFWGAQANDPYADEERLVLLQVKGSLKCLGSEAKPIEMYPADGYEEHAVLILGEGSDFGPYYGNFEPSDNITMSYVSIVNPNISIGSGDHLLLLQNGYQALYYDVKADQVSLDLQDLTGSLISANSISNTRICGFYGNDLGVGYDYPDTYGPRLYAADCDRVLVNNSAIYFGSASSHLSNTFRNSVFLTNYAQSEYEGIISPGYSFREDVPFSGNAILNDSHYETWFKVKSSSNAASAYDATGNYWGTIKEGLIEKQIVDFHDNPLLGTIDYSGHLTLESPELESIYPFVTDAFIADAEGNRLDTVSGSQTVQLHVRFNRDMALDVEPMVSFGQAEPYTDYVVDGNWVVVDGASREWVGELSIDPFINQGVMYIRVKDAAAADDKWLLTGTDEARFSFEISSIGAESMTLQGQGGSGQNELSWVQDDYETLAGYNLYRSLSYNPDTDVATQSFTRVNASIISPEEPFYVDTGVEQGVDYYYYFTVTDTAFNESKPSNVVKCTPLDEGMPVIKHAAMPSVTYGNSATVVAEVTDNVMLGEVSLFYRQQGAEDWVLAPMRSTTGSSYQATIAAYEMSIGVVEYYITASDGANVTFCGDPEMPCLLVVSDPVKVEQVVLNETRLSLQLGEEQTLFANVLPTNVTAANLSWKSSDEGVATVNQSGKVVAQAPGTAVITATSGNGKSASCEVKVRKPSATTVTVGSSNAQPGETITVPVSISGNEGVAAMMLRFSYDSSLLTPEGVEAAELMSGISLATGSPTPGTYNVIWSKGADFNGNGVMFDIVFKVSESAQLGSAITVDASYEDGDIVNASHQELEIDIVDGEVNVKEWLLGDVYEDGKLNSHDPLLLQQHLTELVPFTRHQSNLANIHNEDTAINAKDLVKLMQTVVGFTAPASSGDDGLAYSTFSLNGRSSEVENPQPQDALVVSVKSKKVNESGSVSIPVSFQNCGGIAAFKLHVSYDAGAYELVSIEPLDSALGNNFMTNIKDGEAVVTWCSTSNAVIDGDAFNLNFKATGEASSEGGAVTLSVAAGDLCDEDLNDVAFELRGGYIATASVSDPAASVALVYNGKAQQASVADGEGFSLSGDLTGVDAGDYEVVAKLDSECIWSDGSTESKHIPWTIEQAELVAAYVGEEIPYDGAPELAVLVTGFAEGESPQNAKGYTAPTVSAPDSIIPGETYTLVPANGSAANYYFTYEAATLRVGAAPVEVVPPAAASGLVYSASLQTGVVAGESYELSGESSAMNAGDYSAVATLKDGYIWSDGTFEPKVIEWSIAPANIEQASGFEISEQEYTGFALTPPVTLTYEDKTLVAGVDYDMAYSGNIEIGTAIATVTGKGNFQGSCDISFDVVYPDSSMTVCVGASYASPGETITIPVALDGNEGLAAMRLKVSFDDELLDLVDVQAGEAIPEARITVGDAVDGSCYVYWESVSDITADGVLYNLVLKVADDAAEGSLSVVTIDYRKGDICSAAHVDLLPGIENGSVTVRAGILGDVYEDMILDAHDPLLLQQYLTELVPFTLHQMNLADVRADGAVNMKDLVLLAQTVVDHGSASSYSHVMSVSENPASSGQFKVSAGTVQVGEDGSATVPVTFEACPGLAGFKLRIGFDADKYELTAVRSESAIVSESMMVNIGSDEVIVTWYSNEDVTLDGEILYLDFKAVNEEQLKACDITLEVSEGDLCDASGADVGALLSDGGITVAEISEPEEPWKNFVDVPENAWYVTNGTLEYVVTHGIMSGTSDTTFAPNGKVTRAQVAAILYNLAGNPTAVETEAFTDVKGSSWYYDAVTWARSAGVISGYGNGKFGPNDSVTREQLAVMLCNYAKQVEGIDVAADVSVLDAFPDAGKVSSWARESVSWCVEQGIISGKLTGGKSYVTPKGTAVRAEAAQMVRAFDEKVLVG